MIATSADATILAELEEHDEEERHDDDVEVTDRLLDTQVAGALPRQPPAKQDVETLVWEHQRELQRLAQVLERLEAGGHIPAAGTTSWGNYQSRGPQERPGKGFARPGSGLGVAPRGSLGVIGPPSG